MPASASARLFYLSLRLKNLIKAKINTELQDIDFNSPLFNFVRHSGKPLICKDTKRDKRFASDLMVTGPAAIRHYVAMPIRTREGYIIGALCITDKQPRFFGRESVCSVI